MKHLMLAFNILFFATGFMGCSALFVLNLRVRSRLLKPMLVFQCLFLAGLASTSVYFYLANLLGSVPAGIGISVRLIVSVLNSLIYVVVIILARRICPPAARSRPFAKAVEILGGLVIAQYAAAMAFYLSSAVGIGDLFALTASEPWKFSVHVLTGLAMAAFGIAARGPLPRDEPPSLRPLLRGYGAFALLFAPLGFIEFILESAAIPGLPQISFDYLLYLFLNIVSMSAAVSLFRPDEAGVPIMDSVPAERIRALGLSPREAEMAVLIARGLANKEIAGELNISPATVRTHIYNLYQKSGARSRVELLNKLRG